MMPITTSNSTSVNAARDGLERTFNNFVRPSEASLYIGIE
jgi:hypothetical protein